MRVARSRRIPLRCLAVAALSLGTLAVPASTGISNASTAVADNSTSGATGIDYRFVFIDTPGGHGRALGVSDDRTVVGYYIVQAVIEQPFVFTEAGGTTTLPLDTGMRHGGATAISPDGSTIGGWEETTAGDCWAVRWTKATGGWSIQQLMHDALANDPNEVGCRYTPVGVDNDGSVAINNSGGAGAVWHAGGTTTLPGDPLALATTGEAVGYSQASAGASHQPWRSVGNSVALPDAATNGEVRGLAKDGTMILQTDVGAVQRQPDGTDIPLLALPGASRTFDEQARAISDEGEVVGDSTAGQLNGSDIPHGVRWSADGSVTDLNDVMHHAGGETILTARAVNKNGDIAVGASTNRSSGLEVPGLLVALPPIVFVPGVAGSFLVDSNGTQRWLGCPTDHDALALWPNPIAITPSDVLRNASCFGVTSVNDLKGYGPFVDALENQGGMVEYDEKQNPALWTNAGCDTTQQDRHPNLFLFPYDWRLSNADSAQRLADFMGCVRKFYTGPVMVVAHSMGGLVARRYVLDHPNDTHHVREMLTIGTPWLGAPKLVNAELAGDFAPNLLPETVEKIVPTMPGPGQLLPSKDYYNLTNVPPFAEDGWDVNDNNVAHEVYNHAAVDALLDKQYAPFHADVTQQANAFHDVTTAEGSQDDWRVDKTDVHYTVMYGVRTLEDTIGTVKSKFGVNCTTILGVPASCTIRHYYATTLVAGDKTVPVESSSRISDDGNTNYNNLDHEDLIPVYGTSDDDDTTEHTGLTRNTQVINQVLKTDGRTGTEALPNQGTTATTAAATTLQSSLATSTDTSTSTSTSTSRTATPAVQTAATSTPRSQWNIELQGVTDTTITAPTGANDALVGGSYRPQLPDVTRIPEGTGTEMDVIPADSGSYTLSLTAGDQPVRVNAYVQEGDYVVSHTVWADLTVPAGHTGLLTLAHSVASLQVDEDGDGTVETTVPPTFDPTGLTAAYDNEPPTIAIGSIVLGGTREYTLTGTDDNTGVARVLWSVDGTNFHLYDGPIALAAGTTTLYAFADDKAGNRSDLEEFQLAGVQPGPVTTASFEPAPNASGFATQPVTVHLHAQASDGTTVTKLHWGFGWSTASADGDTATFTTSNMYTMFPLVYYATDSAGHDEPMHSMPLAIDTAPPTLTVSSPTSGERLQSLGLIAGQSTESWEGSGVATTQVAIERAADGAYWNGGAWQTGAAWLATRAGPQPWQGDWVLDNSEVPSGSNLLAGSYGIHVRSTDRAGNTATADPTSVAIVSDAAIKSLEAPPGDFAGHQTTGSSINDAGQVTGTVQYYPWWETDYDEFATKWSPDGSAQLLDGPYPPASAYGINATGQIAGNARNQTVKWLANTTEVLLPPGPLGPYASGWTAYDINDNGTVAGNDGWGNWATWNGTVQTQLPHLPGVNGNNAHLGQVSGITDAGLVAGTGYVTTGGFEMPVAATATTAGASYVFPAADSSSNPPVSGITGVTRDGTLLGWGGIDKAPGSAGYTHNPPFVRTPDGTTTWIDLGALNDTCGTATGRNSSGVVVGFGGDCGLPSDGVGNSRAWVLRNGVLHDLTSLLADDSGWVLQQVGGINSSGQIVGTGMLNGRRHGFVLSLGALPSIDTPPAANDLSTTTDVDTPVTVTLSGADLEHDAITWSVGAGPAHGSLSQVSGDNVDYTPGSGFRGDDTFTVHASDGTYWSNTATVTVHVGTPPPPPPVAVITGPSYAGEGATIVLDASNSIAPDGGNLTYAWDLNGDGAFGDATTPTVTLPMSGNASVGLRVTGSTGTAETTKTVTFVNVAPTVSGMSDAVIRPGAAYDATATISDPGLGDTFTATVDYGDGSDPQPVAVHGRSIALHHVYADEGAYEVSVLVCDSDKACGRADARVAVANDNIITLTATGLDFSAIEGNSVTVQVATFTDSDSSATPADTTATITWGDGSAATTGTVTEADDGTFAVTGTHYYADEGSYRVHVVLQSGSATSDASSTATVADAPLSATGNDGLTSRPTVSGLAVATFTDGNPAAPASDFTATIDWGDGTAASAGTVVATGEGAFAVTGSHGYSSYGPRTATVSIVDVGGSKATATSHITVYGLATGGSFVIGDYSATGTAYFWGPQWATQNVLSGGKAPSDFKGFSTSASLPACGATWSGAPGASSMPPASVPDYMAVVVSGTVTQSGSTLTAIVDHLVIVHVTAGYTGDLGHAGSGTVVATIC